MSKWKIFYTDESSLKANHAAIMGDVEKIPADKRVGVHSVIQEMEDGGTREVIEQYHYIYLLSEQAWLGVGIDGLIEYLVIEFNNIGCVLHGRTKTTDSFYRLKKTIREDPDVVGGMSAADNNQYTSYIHHQYPHNRPVLWPEFPDNFVPRVHHTSGHDKRTGQPYEDWTAISRQRQYAPKFTESGPYGEIREH